MLPKRAHESLIYLIAIISCVCQPNVSIAQRPTLDVDHEIGQRRSVLLIDGKARKSLQTRLAGTRWRVVQGDRTLVFQPGSFHFRGHEKQKGIWMATAYNRVGAVAFDGRHFDFVFKASLKEGELLVGGKAFSRIHIWQEIKPLDEKIPPQLYECVLGRYGRAIRGKRHAFVNLKPPSRDLWTPEIEQQLRGTLSYGEVDYIGTARLVIRTTGVYTVDLPGSGTQLRINNQLVNSGDLQLEAGIYNIQLYTNHWGQPYLKYAHAVIREKKTKMRVPFVNSHADMKAFLAQRVDGQLVREVSGFQPPHVNHNAKRSR